MKRVIARSILALAAAAGAVSFTATPARADHLDFRYDHRERYEPRRVWVEPVYEDRATQVWVEPVYRTETVPVFVNERYETQCDRVWVAPVFEYRDVVRYERGRRCVSRERVCVRAGAWQTVERRVLVPAHYRNEDRQVLVSAGHFETRNDRVCVHEGYWQTVAEVDHHRADNDRVSIGFRIGGRF
ncbi:MAG TPA: hypothetical protein VH475_15395 [Tepidisphaeraceae bacterium]|jgi:hypothetical protein